ncbi:MAG: ABC transporter ATP-binding protein [Deinococcaceae bacterium]
MTHEKPDETGLRIEGVRKHFGQIPVLENIHLDIRQGEFFTLLGPSGCGKTTLLRTIAGFESPDSGKIFLSGKDLTSVPAHQRPVNTVFQSYALFPHLSVFENIAFGLKSRRIPKLDTEKRVQEALELVHMEAFKKRFPQELSGGQKQRIALARALVNQPQVLLLDEPLSALDAQLRAEVQIELRRLQKDLGTTFILVTHDQSEAMGVSDRMAVMRSGRIEQIGTPTEVYDVPESRFVAEFLGAANLIEAIGFGHEVYTALGNLKIHQSFSEGKGTLAIRSEAIGLFDEPAPNRVQCVLKEVVYRGSFTEVFLEPVTATELELRAKLRPLQMSNLQTPEYVWAELPVEALVSLKRDEP